MLSKPIPPTMLSVVLFLSELAAAEQLQPASAVGTAYDRDSGSFLYSEHHFCLEEDMQCTVQYRNRFGIVFAKKELDYSKSSVSPSLVMTDYHSGLKLRVPASQQENLVVDAGFDNFVRRIWDNLDAGENTKFPFLGVGFAKPLKMNAMRSNSVTCTTAELCLEISLDSWLLGMIVDPIELSYSRAERRLQRFSGTSNIKGENGEPLNVDIHYQYDETPDLLAPIN